MTPPTPTEVTEYAKSINFILDGEYFCDRYEVKGWCYGKDCKPMKSWKSAVRLWKRNQGGLGIGKAKSQVGSTGGFVPSKPSII